MAFRIPSKTPLSTPSGLSGVFSRKGGTPEMITALLTPFDRYLPKYRATSPPPIDIGDDTVAGSQKRRDLLLPRSTAQWISVDKDYGVTRSMIFIVEFDVTGVFLTDIHIWH